MPTRTFLGVSFVIGAAVLLAVSLTPQTAWASPTGPKPTKAAVVWDSADVARDGTVDWKDVVFVMRHMGERCTAKRRTVIGDLNRDCRVDGHDLSYVIREAHRARTQPKPPSTPVNAPPLPKADTATTVEDAAVTIAVLANDSDSNGDALRVTAAGAGRLGATAVRPDGTVSYTPAPNAHGADSFSYTVADAQGLSFYSDAGVCRRLIMDQVSLSAARRQLIEADLVAYQKPLYQVLSLPEDPKSLAESAAPRTGEAKSVAAILRRALEGGDQ